MHGDKFFTSDWHLYHKKIQEYCPSSRKGDTPEQMTDMILTNVSEQAKPGDEIFNVGDVSFGTFEQTEKALLDIKRMGINHHLILGNHDKRIRDSSVLRACFESVGDMKAITLGKQVIIMSHFAYSIWDRKHYGSWHFFGHSHGGYQQEGKCMDVGLDTRPVGDMKMWTYDELAAIMKFQPTGKHH